MNEIEFIQHPKLKEVLKGYEKLNNEKQHIGYNLFMISSYTSHLERYGNIIIMQRKRIVQILPFQKFNIFTTIR